MRTVPLFLSLGIADKIRVFCFSESASVNALCRNFKSFGIASLSLSESEENNSLNLFACPGATTSLYFFLQESINSFYLRF